MFNKYSRQLKSLFKIFAYFESILTKFENKEQKADESCTDNCQGHIACSYAYKSICRFTNLEFKFILTKNQFTILSSK